MPNGWLIGGNNSYSFVGFHTVTDPFDLWQVEIPGTYVFDGIPPTTSARAITPDFSHTFTPGRTYLARTFDLAFFDDIPDTPGNSYWNIAYAAPYWFGSGMDDSKWYRSLDGVNWEFNDLAPNPRGPYDNDYSIVLDDGRVCENNSIFDVDVFDGRLWAAGLFDLYSEVDGTYYASLPAISSSDGGRTWQGGDAGDWGADGGPFTAFGAEMIAKHGSTLLCPCWANDNYLISHDSGATWTYLTAPDHYLQAAAYFQGQWYAAAARPNTDGVWLWTSTDGGSTFSPVSTDAAVYLNDLKVSADGARLMAFSSVFTSDDYSIWTSTDGASWTSKYRNGTDTTDYIWRARYGGGVWMAIGGNAFPDGTGAVVVVSLNDGVSWSRRSSPALAYFAQDCNYGPVRSDFALLSGAQHDAGTRLDPSLTTATGPGPRIFSG